MTKFDWTIFSSWL